VNAEESRAVGVSGLQPRIPPLYGSSHLILSSWSVAVWRSRERSSRAAHQKSSISEDGAKPPLLLSSAPVTSICCFCQQGVVAASIDSEVSVGLLRPTGTRRTLRGFAFTISAFRILSHWLADRPPPKVVRNPLRSDQTLLLGRRIIYLKAQVEKLKSCYGQWVASPVDGAYPWRERRSIAPAPHITHTIRY